MNKSKRVAPPFAPVYGPWPLPNREATERLVRSYVVGTTEDRARLVDHICVTGDCILHAAHMVFGKTCWCQTCKPGTMCV